MTLAEKALQIASSFVGVKEATGNNDGGVVNFFQRYCADIMTLQGNAIAEEDLLGQPWCAAFATSCIDIAGTMLGLTPHIDPVHCSSAWLYEHYKTKGLIVAPKAGVLGFLRGGPNGHQHTFLVEYVDEANGLVHTIDGNESNQVECTSHRILDCDFAEYV